MRELSFTTHFRNQKQNNEHKGPDKSPGSQELLFESLTNAKKIRPVVSQLIKEGIKYPGLHGGKQYGGPSKCLK